MLRALVIHSQPEALGELVDLLVGPGLSVDTARSAPEALHKLGARSYAVVVSDHRPPDLDGVALLLRSMELCPDAMRIVMAADQEAVKAVDEMLPGAIFRFFSKPFERWQLAAVVREGLKLHQMEREQKELIKRISVQQLKLQRREKLLDVVVGERTKELEKSYDQLRIAYRQAMMGLAEAIEAKDPYTKGHCARVAAFTLALARDAKYPAEDMEALEFGSFLHDIGKIGIRDAVLLKPGPLDEQEWVHMREHPVKGYEIASKLDVLTPTMPAIRNHHEKFDGTGYPDRLKGLEIPLAARICAIADAFDAMATDRPYKKALPIEECQRLIRKQAGKMFDPDLAEIFVTQTIPELAEIMFGDQDDDDDYAALPPPPPDTGGVPEMAEEDSPHARTGAIHVPRDVSSKGRTGAISLPPPSAATPDDAVPDKLSEPMLSGMIPKV